MHCVWIPVGKIPNGCLPKPKSYSWYSTGIKSGNTITNNGTRDKVLIVLFSF